MMRIRDQRVWAALEKRLALVLHQITEEASVVYTIDCFYRANQDSQRLWNALESALLTTICPKHSMSPRAVATVLHAFGSMDKGSQQLLEALEQQVLRVAADLQGSDVIKVLNVFVKNKLGGDELYKSLNRQTKAVCGQMTPYEVALVTCLFLRMDKATPDLLDRLEAAMKREFTQLTLRSIVSVVEAYAKHLSGPARVPGARREFIVFFADEITKAYEGLVSKARDESTRLLVCLAWGLSALRVNTHLALLRRLLSDLRSRDLQDCDRTQLMAFQRYCQEIKLT